MAIIDETGATRYTMTRAELERLYKEIERFVADCSQQEYNENKQSITTVYSLIHKHIQRNL